MITNSASRANRTAPVMEGRAEMKALVFHGPGRKVWEDVADPGLLEPHASTLRRNSAQTS